MAKVDIVPRARSVWIFVDDSNLWIEGKKALYEHKGLQKDKGFNEDRRARVDIGKMTKVIAKGRPIGGLNFYGSKPPPHDSVWAKAKKAGYELNIFDKSRQGKEKKVVTQLTWDVAKLTMKEEPCILIIVSGDADLSVPAEEALQMNWTVEVYGWIRNISRSFRELNEYPNFSLHELDKDIENFMFVELEYRPERVTREHLQDKLEKDALVVEMHPDMIFQKENHDFAVKVEVVAHLEKNTKLPIQYYVMPSGEEAPTRVVLAICAVNSTDCHFIQNATKALKPQGCVPSTFANYRKVVKDDFFKEMYQKCKPEIENPPYRY